MRLTRKYGGCDDGTCPAIYETDRGTFAVQGRLVTDPEALGDGVNLAADEVIVEIPKSLVRFFPTPE